MNHHPGDEPASRSRHLPSPPPQPTVGDRKSTRLNSSHLVISYAVFCLKKKKYVEVKAVVLESVKTELRRFTWVLIRLRGAIVHGQQIQPARGAEMRSHFVAE